MIIDHFTSDLELKEPGLWVSRKASAVSYPKAGNSLCFSIEDTSFWFAHRNRCIVQVLKNYPSDGFILDVGGGNGFVSLALQKAGWEVVLMEPGVEGALHGRARGLHNVINSTFEDAGIKNNSVPAVGLFDVLEHLQDDIGFLKKLRAVLTTDGKLYITVPAYNLLWSTEDDFAGHCRRYSASQLSRTLHAAGFKIEFVSYTFFLLPLPILFFRSLPSRIGLMRDSTTDREDHRSPEGLLGRLLTKLLAAELSYLKKRHGIPFGGSVLAVAIPS